MKKVRTYIENCGQHLEQRWNRLSHAKQQRFILLAFAGYLVIATMVAIRLFHETENYNTTPSSVDHIENPVLEKKKNASMINHSTKKSGQ